jgi:hypothetical protein
MGATDNNFFFFQTGSTITNGMSRPAFAWYLS